MEISVGKFTLESLTTGMYSEPESCFREYIQNAVDSIDNAVHEKIINLDESRIEIIVDSNRQEISVKDNGTGIGIDRAAKTLLDIGNSTKIHNTNRGFRGIGRLGGLSYCQKLSFCTTAKGEGKKTLITFDCEKLKELLVPGQNDDYTLQTVIDKVTTVEILEEQPQTHYFIVRMEGVDDISSLLDIDIVKDYVSQVAPLPFDSKFFWEKQIKNELLKKGYSISEYPIFLGTSFETLSQLFKPYKRHLDISARTNAAKDEIYSLSFFDINSKDGKAMAYGWYADTDFSGTIADERISGIRVRQGNILIGTSKTLSSYFKESRFNGWSIGEIYVFADELIPNARRDDFEKNDSFSVFEDEVRRTIGTEISDKIRAASKARNNPSQRTVKKAEQTLGNTEDILNSGFNSSFEKDQVLQGISQVKKELKTIPKAANPEIVEQKENLLAKAEELEEAVSNSTNYKAKNDVSSDFSKDQKKVIQAFLEVLSRNFERETVDSIFNEVLIELKAKGRK